MVYFLILVLLPDMKPPEMKLPDVRLHAVKLTDVKLEGFVTSRRPE
jgi:hypothetical protein